MKRREESITDDEARVIAVKAFYTLGLGAMLIANLVEVANRIPGSAERDESAVVWVAGVLLLTAGKLGQGVVNRDTNKPDDTIDLDQLFK